MTRLARWLAPATGLVVFFGLWEVLVRAFGVEAFILPKPSHIISAVWTDRSFFLREAGFTARETLAGLGLALAAASVVAIPMARWRSVDRAVQPIATLIQVVPVVCFAPALVIWLRPGSLPIVVASALISFVPLLFNLVVGLRSADPAVAAMLRTVGATRWEHLKFLQLPSALPHLFSGLRIAVGLALVGAVLGEPFALRSHGLGIQIFKGINGGAKLIWSSAVCLGLLGGLALGLLAIVERIALRGRTTHSPVDVGNR